MPNKPWLLFFGRLDTEKGIKLIIEMVEMFWKTKKELPFNLFIFWDGKYREQVLDLAEQYEEVRYFGRKKLEEIRRYKDNINFGLLPSSFLETFGLTFLETISWWIPVIWFKKWGAWQFILDEHDILQADWKTQAEQLFNTVSKNIHIKKTSKQYKTRQNQIWEITNKYTKDQWIKNFEKLTKAKRVLIVSDFTARVWGIETYIHTISQTLSQNGVENIIYWLDTQLAKKSWFKLLTMLSSIINIWERFRLKRIIKEYQPELVFYNSMLRYFSGHNIIQNPHWDTWMMYHDFGYFAPFPSKVDDVNKVEKKLNFRNFVFGNWATQSCLWKIKSILISPFLSGKLILVKFIQHKKDKIDLHLVPSKFMETTVTKSYWIPSKKVKTLNHFG